MTVTDAGLESTFVHAVVSKALPENLDMLGECLNCTWGTQRKGLPPSQVQPWLLTGPLFCQQNKHIGMFSWSQMAVTN